MKLLFVAATFSEIAPLAAHYDLEEATLMVHDEFDILITGVGMTATAFALGRQLSERYGLVINLGIAGSFDKKISLGTVLAIQSDTFAELGAENGEHFLSIEELGFGKGTFYPSASFLADSSLQKVHAITVNRVHGDEKSISDLLTRVPATIESMEGAAVFYCCEQLQLPSFQIRSISNYIERRNRAAWNIGLAIDNLNKWALDFLFLQQKNNPL